MPLDILLDSLHKRVPWSAMKAMLKMCNLPIGRGWVNTIEKLRAESKTGNTLIDNFAQLKDLYCNHLLVGEKAIKLFSADRKTLDNLIVLLQNIELKQTIFHDTFPFPLSPQRLEELEDKTPELVEIKDFNDNLVLVFCTKRTFTERTELNPKELSPEVQKDLGYYDKLVGTKEYNRQFFDIVVLWKKKDLVEIRIDIANEMLLPDRIKAFSQIASNFNNLVGELSGLQTLFKNPVNLFPLIDSLYHSNEGKVVEIAFTTDEGSIKSEKMRRGFVDLRKETYHNAGKQAVDHITLYRLAILWDCPIVDGIKTQPELFLPSQNRSLSSVEQHLDEVLVTKCAGLIDYNFIFEKINTYLNDGS